MVNEKKLHQMIRVVRFEQKAGAEDLRINKYYRRDYVAFAMIRNFFIVTIGYGLLLGALLLFYMDFLLNTLKTLNIQAPLVAVIAGYLVVLALYTVLVYTLRSLRYHKAQRRVKSYYRELKKLRDMQAMEEMRSREYADRVEEDY